MSVDAKKLSQLISRIDQMKEKQASLEGAKKALLEQIENEYGVSTLNEAAKLYRKLQGEIQKEENEIESDIYKVEELLYDTEY